MLALEYAQSSPGFDRLKKRAARAYCVLTWLEFMDHPPDTSALVERIQNTTDLNTAFNLLKEDAGVTSKLHHIANVMFFIFGFGLDAHEWRPAKIDTFTDEVWDIINFKE